MNPAISTTEVGPGEGGWDRVMMGMLAKRLTPILNVSDIQQSLVSSVASSSSPIIDLTGYRQIATTRLVTDC